MLIDGRVVHLHDNLAGGGGRWGGGAELGVTANDR